MNGGRIYREVSEDILLLEYSKVGELSFVSVRVVDSGQASRVAGVVSE